MTVTVTASYEAVTGRESRAIYRGGVHIQRGYTYTEGVYRLNIQRGCTYTEEYTD